MSATHLSMRVPWRDRPWDDAVCDDPLDNSSCVLLANIGSKRDDAYEQGVAGRTIGHDEQQRLPCLSERATFMSPRGYRVRKTHPYSRNGTLKEHLQPTDVTLPGHAFEAVPFRWLSRETFVADIWDQDVDDYDASAEAAVDRILGFSPGWIMDADNQQAVIRQFFQHVMPEQSLVFVYLKHSPLQETSNRRLLVGAAMVTGVQAPALWNQKGTPPFSSSMWETVVSHSLRPDMRAGILLPYQALVAQQDGGVDISDGLAFAPMGSDAEFSYVTEHVSQDTSIDALAGLLAAAQGCRRLGLDIPDTALAWVEAQIERLWELRGPTPGLGAVFGHLGVPRSQHVARAFLSGVAPQNDPWHAFEDCVQGRTTWPDGVQLPDSAVKTWKVLDGAERDALKILSAMELRQDQVSALMNGHTEVPLSPGELVDNPYYAAICTYGQPEHVSFSTVDRACYPADHVRWPTVLPERSGSTDPQDRRRVEALLVDVLENLADGGDTISAQSDAVALANQVELTRKCSVSEPLLRAHGLDAASSAAAEDWTPLVGVELADGAPGLKLRRLADVRATILDKIEDRRRARRFVPDFASRTVIDAAMDQGLISSAPIPAEEEAARTEKAAGLDELYASRLSVLLGAAGTGKTTLLKALVSIPEVSKDGVLLLAPTGKARVQLQQKVKRPAQTLASFLVPRGGYDPASGRYRSVPSEHAVNVGLVVIDEASMLTEEMLAATLSALGRVTRLVLVGDPRQLPPIGAGRPFVDIVEWLRPADSGGPVRVAPGFVELTVFRRQDGADRDDLTLASWFGDGDLPATADEIWQRLRDGSASATVQAVRWKDGDVTATVMEVLERELDLDAHHDREAAFKLTYGGTLSEDGRYVNWHTGTAGAGAEEWQILSPTRSRAFGTVEINRHIKRTFRGGDLASAHRTYGWRNTRPLGPEQIVRGDKVMQTRNRSNVKAYPHGKGGLDYVANGEIGVVVRDFGKAPKWTNVEFSSQPGYTYGYWPSSKEDADLELAWAVTVHKSQGSEFRRTFVIVPARAAVSRELMYTALTRQTGKVVILHEGPIEDLLALAAPTRSETARRLTDLFRPSAPREVPASDGPGRFDANLIHLAPGNVLVRSKNEVIIAGILESVAPGRWHYEQPFTGSDGTRKLPDFTIETRTGESVYWEHLGLLHNPRYAAAWTAKLAWYETQGVVPYDSPHAPGPRGVLMWTDDRDGVDEPAWRALAERIVGVPSTRRAPAKKAIRKGPGTGAR